MNVRVGANANESSVGFLRTSLLRGTMVKQDQVLLVKIRKYIVFVCTVGPIYYVVPRDRAEQTDLGYNRREWQGVSALIKKNNNFGSEKNR